MEKGQCMMEEPKYKERYKAFCNDFKQGRIRVIDLDLLIHEKVCLQVYCFDQLSQLLNRILFECHTRLGEDDKGLGKEIADIFIIYSSAFNDEHLSKEIKKRIKQNQFLEKYLNND